MSKPHNSFKVELIEDLKKNKIFNIGTYAVLFLVSLVMTIMNIVTHKEWLILCTGVFAALCLINIALVLINEKTAAVSKVLLAVEVLAMFTYFLVSGNPEGFSCIWICMLPSVGMFYFGKRKGSIICVTMFVILVFFLWIPDNPLLHYDGYSGVFKMRFPILFVAFHALAYFLELLRENAYNEIKRMREYYKDLSAKRSADRHSQSSGIIFIA